MNGRIVIITAWFKENAVGEQKTDTYLELLPELEDTYAAYAASGLRRVRCADNETNFVIKKLAQRGLESFCVCSYEDIGNAVKLFISISSPSFSFLKVDLIGG